MKKWGLLLILLLSLLPRTAFAAETADAICIEGETEGLDTDAVDAAAEEMDAEVSFSDLLAEILSGEFDFTFANIREKASELMFGELRMQGKLLAQLVLIVILSAILKQCSDSFQGKNVGEMGFYVCYMVLIVAILTSFYSISQSVVERMRGLCGVFGAMVPIFLVLSASSGNLAQGALMGPTLMGGATALSVGISYVLIPAIQLSIALEMADHISEKPIQFTSFPLILLISTVYRLALNLSSTRLILANVFSYAFKTSAADTASDSRRDRADNAASSTVHFSF